MKPFFKTDSRLTETVDPLIETLVDLTQTFAYDEAGNLIEAINRKAQCVVYSCSWPLIIRRITPSLMRSTNYGLCKC